MESQLRKASEARHILSEVSFLAATLGSLVLDALLVAGGWVTGSASRIAMTLLGIDVVLLGLWVIGIPIRRWLARSPY
jgi:hypothetical protein